MSQNASAIATVVIIAVGWAGGYFLSLWLHPEKNCPRCKGQGRHWGGMWTRSRRQCTNCGGTGRVARTGTFIWERVLSGRSSRFRRP